MNTVLENTALDGLEGQKRASSEAAFGRRQIQGGWGLELCRALADDHKRKLLSVSYKKKARYVLVLQYNRKWKKNFIHRSTEMLYSRGQDLEFIHHKRRMIGLIGSVWRDGHNVP